ncbi:unnamed protein product, partial [Amoebophrya sp. A120]
LTTGIFFSPNRQAGTAAASPARPSSAMKAGAASTSSPHNVPETTPLANKSKIGKTTSLGGGQIRKAVATATSASGRSLDGVSIATAGTSNKLPLATATTRTTTLADVIKLKHASNEQEAKTSSRKTEGGSFCSVEDSKIFATSGVEGDARGGGGGVSSTNNTGHHDILNGDGVNVVDASSFAVGDFIRSSVDQLISLRRGSGLNRTLNYPTAPRRSNSPSGDSL